MDISHNIAFFDEVSFSYGNKIILKDASFALKNGEKACLVGRNGSGKSTLFKLINNLIFPDSGSIIISPSVKISLLNQDLPAKYQKSAYDYINDLFAEERLILSTYEELISNQVNNNESKISEIENQIKKNNLWQLDSQIKTHLEQFDLNPDQHVSTFSGGMLRKLTLAASLIKNPDLLLLDEPTNHLDIDSIRWLEKRIRDLNCTVLCISHDRLFINKIADRVIDIDRGQILSWPGGYDNYQENKIIANNIEDRHERKFQKELDKEEEWIRKGVKAREKRNEGRVRNLIELRDLKNSKIKRLQKPKININFSQITPGKKIFRAKNLTLGFGSTEIFQRLDFEIKRGDRIGIIGANGSGKSTLLSALRGDIIPITGTLKNGTNLEFSTFFQDKYNINFDLLMKDYVSDKKDYVDMNGNSRHIIGYLKGFLFNPDECLSPLKTLSGGQVNRSILAKTFLKPSNLLILDEPTNDLDIESLEALEDALLSYKGTLIVVSHDRYFLDKVVNRIFAVKKDNSLTTNFYGNYSEWLEKETLNDSPTNQQSDKKDNKKKNNDDKKVSYIAQRNIDKLMKDIEILELELTEDADYLSCSEFKELSYKQMSAFTQKYNEKKVHLDTLYDEWEKLNS